VSHALTPLNRRGQFRILVVDDNEDAADTLAVLLRMSGHDVQTAFSGEDAVETALREQPDCMLLDIRMPRMDGYQLARRLRREPRLERSRLVALSAYSSEDHARRAREAGFDHWLVKPADPTALEGLLTMLQQALKLAERTEALAEKNAQLAEETKALLTEVKEELADVKEEIREVKQEIREVRGSTPGGLPPTPPRPEPPDPSDRADK
jgi:two-component system OmpR family response regulator